MSALKLLHRWTLRLSVAVAATWLFAAPLSASFDDVGAGARGAGMADAQTAIADDASAAFNNPAGLIQIGDQRLGTEFGQYVRGLTDGSQLGSSFLGYVRPVKPGQTVLSAGYHSFRATDILEEKTYLLGGGTRLDIAPFGWEGVWSVGGNLKMLERSFNTDAYASNAINDAGVGSGQIDPVLAAGKKSAFSVDGGALYQFGRDLENSFGVVIMNANRPKIGVASNDHAPEIVKFGAAHRPKWGVLTAEVRHAYRLTGNPDTDLALGVERNFRLSNYSAAVVRAGYAEGSRGYQVATMGAAYHFGRFSFDYAFSFPIGDLSQTDGGQHMGFSMRFGGSTTTVKMPVTPAVPVVLISTPAVVASTAPAPEIQNAVDKMKEMPSGVEQDMATLQQEIDALRKASGLIPAVSTAAVTVQTSTPTAATPVAVATATAVEISTHAVRHLPTKPAVKPVKPARPHVAAPAAKPAQVKKPAAAAGSSEADQAWQFYQEAVARDISDQEKIELLESMVERFGEDQAHRVQAELDKLRKRTKGLRKP